VFNNWLLRRLLALWVRYTVRPDDAVEPLRARNNPVCYVLERRDVTDLAVLQNACVRHKLPRPQKRLTKESRDLLSYFYLTRPLGFWLIPARSTVTASMSFTNVVQIFCEG